MKKIIVKITLHVTLSNSFCVYENDWILGFKTDIMLFFLIIIKMPFTQKFSQTTDLSITWYPL